MAIDFVHARSNILEQRQKWKTVLQIVTVSVICFDIFTRYTDLVATLKALVHIFRLLMQAFVVITYLL